MAAWIPTTSQLRCCICWVAVNVGFGRFVPLSTGTSLPCHKFLCARTSVDRKSYEQMRTPLALLFAREPFTAASLASVHRRGVRRVSSSALIKRYS